MVKPIFFDVDTPRHWHIWSWASFPRFEVARNRYSNTPKKDAEHSDVPPKFEIRTWSMSLFFLGFVYFRFPQQRKIMGSSAQNSSGVHWCRRRVRFNEVPEKVPEKVGRLWCRARWGSTGFRRRFRKRFQEALVQSQVRFNGFRRGSGEGLGGFGAEKVPEKVGEALEHAEVFPALGFAACFRKIGKNKTLRLLGIPRKFFFLNSYKSTNFNHFLGLQEQLTCK